MAELKLCPFCGGSALLRGFAVDEAMHWWATCENCGATSGELLAESTPDRDFAVESWNHRTHPQPVTPAGGEVVYQLRDGGAWFEVSESNYTDFNCQGSRYEARKLYTHPPAADAALLEVERAAKFVRDTFKRDMEQGYKTKDKTFAVDVLDAALNQRGGG